ncbi:MAG: hypothetical protein JSR15_09440 [Proteobacteria bacterium]|nr:hypothetical protein [Pseudomonadota bacterium]
MSAIAPCHIERQPAQRVLEFVAFRWPADGCNAGHWPCAPGRAARDGAQHPRLLHIAPGRWLLPAPDETEQAQFDAAARAGQGAMIDVTGKWEHFTITGVGAARLLACTIDIHSVLEGRDCAAVRLFDCPAVVASMPDGYALWVQSSYVADFLATTDRFLATARIGAPAPHRPAS